MSASASVRESGTRAYGYEMETPHATGPVAPGLEDVVARLIARASGTVEPAGAPQPCMQEMQAAAARCRAGSFHYTYLRLAPPAAATADNYLPTYDNLPSRARTT